MISLSIVVPVFNEEENIVSLHREINEVCKKNKYKYEIIFVNDGSTDGTADLAKKLKPVKCINLRKNFGQTAAMSAGIDAAKYDYIVTMDGDRQNDPEDIPKLVDHLVKTKCDVVSGWRKKRKDRLLKRFISRVAHLLRSMIIQDGIHDSGCSLKIYAKKCFENTLLYGEMHRFIPALLKIKGFQIGEIVVNHRARMAGVSKYTFSRTLKGFIDMLSVWFWNKYAARPLHLLGGLGFVLLFLGAISTLFTFYLFFRGQEMSETVFPLLSISLVMLGIQMLVSGIIIDITTKIYFEKTKDSPYSIKNVLTN